MKYLVPAFFLAVLAAPASAYIGPGAGAGAILGAIAVVLGIFLLIVGFLWFPVKRYLRGRRERAAAENQSAD